MDLNGLITPEAIIPSFNANNIKSVLKELSIYAAKLTGEDQREIFYALLHRERLGSTGQGEGVAIPHIMLPGIDKVISVFMKLDKPIDFDSIDGKPVDLVFLLLAPEGAGFDHLRAFSRIARLLKKTDAIEKLRNATEKGVIYSILTEPSASHAA